MAEETVITKAPEEMSREELAAAIAEQSKPPVVATTEQPKEEPAKPKTETQTFTFTAGDGTVYEGASQDELFEKVKGALNHTKTAIKDRERQIRELRDRQVKPIEPPKTEEKFDQAKYETLLGKDGLEAQQYLDSFK